MPEIERIRERIERLAERAGAAEAGGADAEIPASEVRQLLDELRLQQELLEAARRDLEAEREWLQATRAPRLLLEEQSARAHAEAAQRREAFLGEASEILAGSLDYQVTLGSVARLAVPRISDSCIVYVVEEDGRVYRMGAAHADPAREEVLRSLLEHHAFDPGSLTGPVARVLRTGEAELLPDVPVWEADPLEDLEDAALAAELAPRSLMVVPLRVRERVLGALSLGWSEPGKYTPEAVWLARKLADRAALAIENARLHREAKRASEVKSDFVAAMSHEFRTPLTAIMAFAELLVEGIPEPVTGAPLKHAEQILGASKHLAELIDQVLTLSRIDAGRERVRTEPVDLPALVRDTAALVEPLARQKELPVRVEVPERGPVIHTDPNKVRQVLFNLLGNAVKFTDRGEIRVVLREEDDCVCLEVHDTGEGIPPEHLESIWEPFWRATRPGGSRPPGTGLGLGIVKRLVGMLGGEIQARSEPGRGSVFAVELKATGRDP
ncbi:MAG: GAF domain-containing sensor histidine kinase [Gemmatimonadota bacterium]|nr:GAF domain-containing sensor histidine kinase [Gemmatimonadota bacterium]